MKKILIIVGILLLLIAGAIGAYISVNGVPESVDEVFGNFTKSTDAPVFTEEDTTEEDYGDIYEDQTNTTKGRLRQLTTRPTAGAVFTDSVVRFVERGTGHIYEIDLRSGGDERIISGTTQPRTVRAVFSRDGNNVALTHEESGRFVTTLGTLSREKLDMTLLPDGAEEVGFSADGLNLNFFIPTARGGTAYAYSLEKNTATEVFQIPFNKVRILWGSPTHIYTTPSYKANGYVYRIGKNGTPEYVTKGGRGLMAIHHASGTIVSTVDDGKFVTRDVVTGPLPIITMYTEKCAVDQGKPYLVVCASPIEPPNTSNYPDDWFKGIVGFTDRVLSVNSASSSITVLSNLEAESGRPIDVSGIGTDATGALVYLINKYDNALWLLDLR